MQKHHTVKSKTSNAKPPAEDTISGLQQTWAETAPPWETQS